MEYLIYVIENNKEKLVLTMEGSYESVKQFINKNSEFFKNGYKIYEKKFIEDGKP